MVVFSVSIVSSRKVSRVSSASMRPLNRSVSLDFMSLIGMLVPSALREPMAERDPFVEHEAFALPSALLGRHAFEVFQDAALEVVDLLKAARQQIGTGLFAADAAGAEHRDPAVLLRIEFAGDEIPELPKTLDPRIDRAGKASHLDLEGVTGVDQQRVRRGDQVVPRRGIDIGPDPPGGIGGRIAERDDLLLQPD